MSPPAKNAPFSLRRGTHADVPFLRRMLMEAAFWRPGAARPSMATALADPRLRRYVDNWGRAGDAAVLAHVEGVRIGATWYRLFPPEEPGYGFIGAAIPEITVAVVPEQRGRGVGPTLLRALAETAAEEGYPALSLSVEETNRALRLYEGAGWQRVRLGGGAWTMRLDLGS
jgi:ribosomal protein S18 acetylase RimI-like enzyme